MILLKRFLVFCCITITLCIISVNSIAQNLIPLDWSVTFNQDSIPRDVCLLTSWERQGLGYIHGQGKISTSFNIPPSYFESSYTLELSLRMDIDSILINGYKISSNIKNHFQWSVHPNYPINTFTIPVKYLFFNQTNIITVQFSSLSYTGGLSHNQVRLFAGKENSESELQLIINKKDHCFSIGEEVLLQINTNRTNKGKALIRVKNDYSELVYTKEITLSKRGVTYFGLKKVQLPPGFYEISVIRNNDGYVGDVKWVAVAPTKIVDKDVAPENFMEYWKLALEELALVVPNYRMTKVDSLCSDFKDGYVVEMQCINDVNIRGYYFTPKQRGVYPVILHLPGYGYGFDYIDGFKNNQDEVVELALCVRGHGLSKDAFVLDDSPGFLGHGICNKVELAYRAIYMDCIRAVDFLYTQNKVDTTKIGVFGGSQGGGLALATAALASGRVNACAYFDPFPCDLNNHIKTRTIIKDEIKGFLDFYNNHCSYQQSLQNLSFIDTKYFAQAIKCQVYYTTGLLDDDCPSRLGFSVYNMISGEKSYTVFPNDSHIGESGYHDFSMDFFKRIFSY